MGLTRAKITNIDTSVELINDPITILNYGATQANVDVGFLINRANGLLSNVAIYWNEAQNSFATVLTDSTGGPNSNINIVSYASVTTGNLLPGANTTYNLGSSSVAWGTLYSDTIDMYGATITTRNGRFVFTNADGTATDADFHIVNAHSISAATIGNSGAILYGTLNSASASQPNITTLPGLTNFGQANSTTTAAGNLVIDGNLTVNGATNTISNTIIETNEYVITIDATTVRGVTIGNSGAVLYGTLNSASASQPNITTLGNLTSFGTAGITTTAAGDLLVDGNLTVTGTTNTINNTIILTNQYISTIDALSVKAETIGNSGAILYGTLNSASAFQPNITTVGTLTNLTVSGTTTLNTTTAASFQGPIGNATPNTGNFTSLTSSTTATLNTVTVASIQGPIGNATPNTGNFTTVTANTVNAATIGNIGANIVGTGTYLTELSGGNITPGTVPNSALEKNTISGVALGNTLHPLTISTGLSGTSYDGSANVTIQNTGVLSITGTANQISANVSTGSILLSLPQDISTTATPEFGGITIDGNTIVNSTLYARGIYDEGVRVVSTSSGSGNLAITGPAIALAHIGPGAVTVGNTSAIPVITTDIFGRVTSLSTSPISTAFTLNGTMGGQSITNGSTLVLAGNYGVTIEVGAEYANIGTPQDLRTTASPSFRDVTATDTIVASTITAGTINAATIGNSGATLTGTIQTEIQTNILRVGTLTELTADGVVQFTSNQNSSGVSYTSGALQIAGGVGIGRDLYVQGNIYAANLISQSSTTLLVNDPLVYLSASNPETYDYEIGLYSHFGNGASYQHTGLVRDHNDGTWKLFSNVAEPIGGTVDFGDALYDTLKIGSLTVANSTISSSTTTGAVVIAGGVGVGGNLYIQDYLYANEIYDNGSRVLTGFNSYGAGNVAISLNAPTDTTIYLAETGPGAVTTGSGSAIPVITTDAYGRIEHITTSALTAVTNLSSGGAGNISVSSATGSANITLPKTGPGAVTTGSSTAIPVITTDEFGRVSGTTTAAVIAPAGTLTGTTLNSGVTASSLTSVGTLLNLQVGPVTSSGNIIAAEVHAAIIGNAGAILTGTLSTASQPNITSIGTLSSLIVSGNTDLGITTANSITSTGSIVAHSLNAETIGAIDSTLIGSTLTLSNYANIAGPLVLTNNNSVTSLQITGTATASGAGYHDFLSVTNLNPGVTNPNKYFRLDSGGNIQIVNSANDTNLFEFTDSGHLYLNTGRLYVAEGLYWAGNNNVISTGGGGSAPAGDSGQIQYNDGGALGATPIRYYSGNTSILVSTSVASTTTTSGALQVLGGVGIVGAVHAGSVYDNGNRVVSTSSGAGNLTISGTGINLTEVGPGATTVGGSTSIPVITTDAYGRIVALTSSAVSTTINLAAGSGSGSVAGGGTLTVSGSTGITTSVSGSTFSITNSGVTNIAGTSNQITASAGTGSVTLSLPSTVVINTLNAATIGNSGATLTGTLSTAAQPNITSLGTLTGLTSSGVVQITNSTSNSGTNYTSGALQVTGGAGIGGDLYVQGNIYAGNLLSTTTQILEVNDPLVYLSASNPGTYNYEIGLYSHFGSGATYQHSGIVRDHNDGTWKFFSNVAEPSGGTINFTNAYYDTVKAGSVLLANSTASTDTTTGALQVTGGVGIGGNLNVGGDIYSAGSRTLTAADLATVTHTATYITNNPSSVTGLTTIAGTSTVYGTYNFGNVTSIQTYGDYDTVANTGFFSINDASGAPGFVTYVGFGNVSAFNRLNFNINYTASSGHTVNIDLYNYQYGGWDTFATYSGSGSWQTFTLGVIDDVPYIGTGANIGNVSSRIYHVSSGNTVHRTWIDYAAVEQSITGGQGPRGPTGATGATGATGPAWAGGYVGAVTTFGANLVANSATDSTSTSTGALIVVGGAGVTGNVNAGAVYDNGNRVLTSLSSSGTGNLTVSVSAPTGTTIALPATGPGAVTTGSASAIPVITTDAYGRIASITTASVSSTLNTAGGTGTGSVALTNQSLTIAGGTGITTSASAQTITVTNSGVTSIAGTSNQVTASASTGGVTLSLPQNIHTGASPSFASMQIGTTTIAPSSISGVGLGTITDATTGFSAPGIGLGSGTGSHGAIVYAAGTMYFGAENGVASGTMNTKMTLSNTGVLTAYNNIVPSANVSYTLGSTSAWWSGVYGKAVQAQYADLAENYVADSEYAPGTVVVFGGDEEITITENDHDPRVAGVISTDPAYLMNATNPGQPVAFTGRVPCQVQGPVTKGDVLVTSNIAGVAQKIDNAKFVPGCVLGKALDSINSNNIETIEIVVGRF